MSESRRGVTLLELMLALVIAAAVVAGAMRVYTEFVRRSVVERRNAQLQMELGNAGRMVENDVRMAGYALPGNGVSLNYTSGIADTVHLFSNEASRQNRESRRSS